MKIIDTHFDAIKVLRPERHNDARGYFVEAYNREVFASLGIDIPFVQDNQSLSHSKGVVRGLHYQLPPFAQAKLVRVLRGSILDVAVDIRRGSPTFGQHVSVTLTAGEGEQILIPVGFAHGFCTLEPETEILYKVSTRYSPAHDRGILWNDPALVIRWPFGEAEMTLSDKDRRQPRLSQTTDLFEYLP